MKFFHLWDCEGVFCSTELINGGSYIMQFAQKLVSNLANQTLLDEKHIFLMWRIKYFLNI
jgi:hypothetical protein